MPGALFFFILSASTYTLSLIKRSSLSFFLFLEYFLLPNSSCHRCTFFVFSNLFILKTVLNLSLAKAFFSISSGERPYFLLVWIFMLATDMSMIFLGLIFNFSMFNFEILVFNSLIFCSAAKALPPLRAVENISTLFMSFISLIFTC